MLHQIHEDSAGNPIHVGIAVLAAAGLATQRRRVPPRALTFLGSAAAAWVLFFLVFRDNPWISRLQTPTFVLTGIAVVALAAIGGAPRRANAWAMSVALAALAHGVVVASWNGPRRPFGPPSFDRDATYYANQPATRSMHDAVLATAQRLGCSRLGLMVGGDSYDYPLTWRAMQAGVDVRHVFGEDAWPCLVFTDLETPPASLATPRWIPTPVPFLYLNAATVGRPSSDTAL